MAAPSVVSNTGATVTVACKMPHGLTLELDEMVDKKVPMMGGTGFATVQEAVRLPGSIKLNGYAHPQDKAPRNPISGGYGLTFNVNREFFEKWLHQHRDSDVVRNELILAMEKPDHAEGKAKEMAEIKCGLERLDPSKPPAGIVAGDKAA